MKRGFSLGQAQDSRPVDALPFLITAAVLLLFIFAAPSFIRVDSRPHAPVLMGLVAGAIIGFLGQRSKFCFMAAWRNLFLMRNTSVFSGAVALFGAALIVNLVLGQTHFGKHVVGAPDYLWNFMGLLVVGIGATFLGGCPFRQLVRASQGNSGAALSVFGMVVGAALAHNMHIAAMRRPPVLPGKIAAIGAIAVLVLVGILRTQKNT